MEFQNTNLKVIVANATTDAAETTLQSFLASGSEGEVMAASSTGAVVAAGTEKFIIASVKNGELDQSEIMPLSNLKKVSAVAYSAATVRSEAVGYNGTSGAIDVIPNNLYQVNIELLNYGSLSPENRYYKQAHYQSALSGETQASIANGLALSLVRNFSREQVQRVTIKVISAAAGAVMTGTGDVSVTKGSKFMTAATDASAVLVAGDFLRIGTGVSDPIYKVVSVGSGVNSVIELDRPYAGATALVGTASTEVVDAAAAAAAAAGIVITGVELPFVVGKMRFEQVDWRPITLVDFGSTGTTVLSSGTKGQGDGRRVAELEWFANGNFQELHRMGEPLLYDYRAELKAVIASGYDVLVLDYYHNQSAGTNLVNTTSPRTIMVCTDSSNSHAAMNGLITDLNKSSLFSISTL